MAETVPIALLVDDPAPLVHVYRWHWEEVHHRPPATRDGRPLLDTVPNDFLDRFCDVMDRWDIRGKFSVVPMPAGRGDIVDGVAGHDAALTRAWIETAQRRLGPRCDFCPEGITHNLAVDLASGGFLPESENDWSQRQTRETLTPYLTRELSLMRSAGFDCTGFTSPWVFGIEAEPEYVAAMVAAQQAVYGRTFSWYFLHMLHERPGTRPWIAYRGEDAALVSIPATTEDVFWWTIDSPRADRGFVEFVADALLTADGTRGQIVEVLEAGGWPIILTHWQSLFSNGLETGLAALDVVGRRVRERLAGRVRWATCMDIARETAAGEAGGRNA